MKNEFTPGNPLIYLISYQIVTVCKVFFSPQSFASGCPPVVSPSCTTKCFENLDIRFEKEVQKLWSDREQARWKFGAAWVDKDRKYNGRDDEIGRGSG